MIGGLLSTDARANTREALPFLGERSTPAQLAEDLGITPAYRPAGGAS